MKVPDAEDAEDDADEWLMPGCSTGEGAAAGDVSVISTSSRGGTNPAKADFGGGLGGKEKEGSGETSASGWAKGLPLPAGKGVIRWRLEGCVGVVAGFIEGLGGDLAGTGFGVGSILGDGRDGLAEATDGFGTTGDRAGTWCGGGGAFALAPVTRALTLACGPAAFTERARSLNICWYRHVLISVRRPRNCAAEPVASIKWAVAI